MHSFRALSWVILCCLLSFFTTTTRAVTPEDSLSQLTVYLVQQKNELVRANQALKAQIAPADQSSLTTLRQQIELQQSLNRAKIVSLESALSHHNKKQDDFLRQAKQLQQLPLNDEQNNKQIEDKLNEINQQKIENSHIIDLLNDNLALAKNYKESIAMELSRLDLLQETMKEQQQKDQLAEKIKVLKQARNVLFENNVAIQEKKESTLDLPTSFQDEAQLLLNNQSIQLLEYHIVELEFQEKMIAAGYLILKNKDIKTLQSVIELDELAIKQLSDIEKSLNKMLTTLDAEASFLSTQSLKNQAVQLKRNINSYLKHINEQLVVLREKLDNEQSQLSKQLGARQHLAEYKLGSWPLIIQQIINIPSQFYGYIKLLALKISDNYSRLDQWSMFFLWGALVLVFLVFGAFAWALHAVVERKERSSLSGHLYDGIIIILYKNIPHLTAVTLLVVGCFLNHVLFANYELLINLFLVWLTFRTLILIARLVLFERVTDVSGRDVSLYHHLCWLLLAGGWSTALMMLSPQLALSPLVQDIFNRLFMLFLLAVSLVIWKSKELIPYLLWPLLKAKNVIYVRAYPWLLVLIPLTLLTTAVIGLIGYINLAWTMSRYQAYVLLLITSYVFVRGLVLDALEFLSSWMIASLHNGWLWIEVFLKPIDKILRVLLILLSIILLFQVFGWSSESHVMMVLRRVGHYPIVNLSGAYITFLSILEFFCVAGCFYLVCEMDA
jgi:potassium-dependent mechanosensitive channel